MTKTMARVDSEFTDLLDTDLDDLANILDAAGLGTRRSLTPEPPSTYRMTLISDLLTSRCRQLAWLWPPGGLPACLSSLPRSAGHAKSSCHLDPTFFR